jgi:NAD(P)-dependent dehydrogenase (short-subunit alcohol dehydrogenase family)
MPFGVDVVVIAPGAVRTAIWDKGLAFDRARYANTAYAPILERFAAVVGQQGAAGLPPEAIGDLAWRAMTIAAPKARYTILKNWLSGWVIPRMMATRTLDRVIARRLGLERHP